MNADIAKKIAAAKARIEALTAKNANPYLSGSRSMPKSAPAPTPATGSVSNIALHPLLMSQANKQDQEEKNEKKKERDRYKTMAPKFSTVKANQAAQQAAAPARPAPTAPILNPYGSGPANTSGPATQDQPIVPRRGRKMQFSAPGKYVRQGDALRNEQKMDALRQRIAEASKKAGLDSEFDTLERSLKVIFVLRKGEKELIDSQRQPPPEVEWWDRAILPDGSNYDDIEKAIDWITTSEDSLITHLIQHPIPIAAPGDKKHPERGLMLTKKEQKKMRRQRRQAELEDKRDRQKMGLLAPDPPKVRLANLMKVLTSDAVQDPTKVEAKVRREVTMRAFKHEKDNEQRKLTPEQRKEKEYQQMADKERKGVYASVYKINYLTNGRHKFKVRETAKKDLLSGVCIFGANFAVVLVEGVDKGIKHYKQLMLSRVDWTEEARPLGDEGPGSDDEGAGAGAGARVPEQAAPESLEDNRCECIWEGEVPERTYKLFRARHAETDTKAKEWLTPKWEGMWDLAKRHVWQGEDF